MTDIRTLMTKISRLESQLLFYQQHHQYCAIPRLPSPPPDDGSSGNGVQEAHATEGLTVIPYQPTLFEKPKTNRCQFDSQWKLSAKELIEKVPNANRWIKQRQFCGLDGAEDEALAILVISGAAGSAPIRTLDASSQGPIAIAKAYARVTLAAGEMARRTSLLKSFQELVLTSLCAVLEYHGYDVALIDEAMRIALSDSLSSNLKRLRDGARWANKLIIQLFQEWKLRATEMLLLNGHSISKFGILARTNCSLDHCTTLLNDPKYTDNFSDSPGRTSFSIPAFIKILVGNQLTLLEICAALGYPESHLHPISQLCDQYSKFSYRMTSAGQAIDNASPKKRRLSYAENSHPKWTQDGGAFEDLCKAANAELSATSILAQNCDNFGWPTNKTRPDNLTDSDRSSLDKTRSQAGLGGSDTLPIPVHETAARGPAESTSTQAVPTVHVGTPSQSTSQDALAQQASYSIDEDIRTGSPLIESQATDEEFEPHETLNAAIDPFALNGSSTNIFPFDYSEAFDLSTTSFDYNSALDVSSFSFDYNAALDVSTFSFPPPRFDDTCGP